MLVATRHKTEEMKTVVHSQWKAEKTTAVQNASDRGAEAGELPGRREAFGWACQAQR